MKMLWLTPQQPDVPQVADTMVCRFLNHDELVATKLGISIQQDSQLYLGCWLPGDQYPIRDTIETSQRKKNTLGYDNHCLFGVNI